MVLTVVGGSYEGHIIGYRLTTPLSSDTAPPAPTFALKAHEGCVRAVATGGALLATSGTDHTIGVYNVRKLKTQGTLQQAGGGASLECLAFYRDSHLVSGSADGELCIWRASDWERLLQMKGHKGAVHAVAIHPSGRAALSVAADSKLMLWNLTTGKCNYTSALAEPAHIVSWASDGESYAYDNRRGVLVYSLRAGELLHTLAHENARPLAMLFASATLLVTGDDAGALRVWSLRSGECVCVVEGAHTQRIKALALAPPRASARADATDAATPAEGVAISSASSDGMISVWKLTEGAKAGGKKRAASGGDVRLTRMVTLSTRLRLTCLCMSETAAAGGGASGGGGAANETAAEVPAAADDDDVDDDEEEEVEEEVEEAPRKKKTLKSKARAAKEEEEAVEAVPRKKKKKAAAAEVEEAQAEEAPKKKKKARPVGVA